MSQIEVDETTNELVRRNGAFQRITGRPEIGQHVRCRLRILQGEVFLLKEAGVDYETVFEKGIELSRITGIFRNVVDETPGIQHVESLTPSQTAEQRALRIMEIDFVAVDSVELLAEEGPLHDTIIIRT